VSETIALRIAHHLRLSTVERRLFVRALTQHVFRGDGENRFLPQMTGQLMGSVVSFPVLCIANAAACRFAFEQTVSKKTSLRDLPALFNGDDVVMKIPRTGYEIWRKVTGFFGLSESVGKTYVSSTFLNVNSTTFNYVGDRGARVDVSQAQAPPLLAVPPSVFSDRPAIAGAPGEVQRLVPPRRIDASDFPLPERDPSLAYELVRYVNMGLFNGMKRSGGSVGAADVAAAGDLSIGARARELYYSCPDSLRSKVMTEYVRVNSQLFKTFRVPWYIPEEFGGLGLPPHLRYDTQTWVGPTEWELRRAASIMLDRSEEVSRTVDTPWHVHKLAMSRFPAKPTPTLSEKDADKTEFVYGKVCVSLLFDSSVSEEDLFSKDTVSDGVRALRCNERLWSKVKPVPATGMTDRLRLLIMSRAKGLRTALPLSIVS